MPFEIPTLKRMIVRAKGDIDDALGALGAAFMRFSVEGALAHAAAALARGLHHHLQWLSKQLFPDTAEREFLDRWAGIFLDAEDGRKAASRALFRISVTGTEGADLPAGTRWRRSDGTLYEVTSLTTLGDAATSVLVRSLEAGQSGNTQPGTELSLTSPIAGVDSTATIEGDPSGNVVGSAVDEETDKELRQRVLERIQSPPRGGGQGDYVLWAKEVAGVTRAWQVPRMFGTGTVGVLFMRDNDAYPFPSLDHVAEVQAYLDEHAPVTAAVFAIAPTEHQVDPTIQLRPNTPEVQAAVTEQLAALFDRRVSPGESVPVWQLDCAIARAVGHEDHVITSPPAIDVGPIEIPTLGTPTFTEL